MLTKQEKKVMNLVCGGCYSDKEAADILHVSTRTIVNHKQNMFHKLGINKATELSAYYWCQKFNTKFDLTEFKKQLTAILLFACLIPGINNFDADLRNSRRNVRNRQTIIVIR